MILLIILFLWLRIFPRKDSLILQRPILLWLKVHLFSLLLSRQVLNESYRAIALWHFIPAVVLSEDQVEDQATFLLAPTTN